MCRQSNVSQALRRMYIGIAELLYTIIQRIGAHEGISSRDPEPGGWKQTRVSPREVDSTLPFVRPIISCLSSDIRFDSTVGIQCTICISCTIYYTYRDKNNRKCQYVYVFMRRFTSFEALKMTLFNLLTAKFTSTHYFLGQLGIGATSESSRRKKKISSNVIWLKAKITVDFSTLSILQFEIE